MSKHILLTSGFFMSLIVGCGGGNGSSAANSKLSAQMGPSYSNPLPILASQPNVMNISVGCGYVNEPCVSVTICVPGTSQCQIIPNVLLDTGSFGLRIFNQITYDFQTEQPLGLSLPLKSNPNRPSQTLAECVTYGDGSSNWGPVATADIRLGAQTAASVPVQIINANFATSPVHCGTPDADPIDAGFNGILGVGVFIQDCGPGCDSSVTPGAANNGIYYSCTSSTCTATGVALKDQVSNPVAFLPKDNNGVVLALTTNVPDSGAESLSGYLVFGIGTEANNSTAGTTTFATNAYGNFTTTWSGTNYTQSFIDSGSNALYFPQAAGLKTCADAPGFYCPNTETMFTAVQAAPNGGVSLSIGFNVANTDDLFSGRSSNVVFNNIAGTYSQFDWGFPFFLGRNVFVGLEGRSSTAGTGPYWAY